MPMKSEYQKYFPFTLVLLGLVVTSVDAANTDALHFHLVEKNGDKKHYSTIPSGAYRRDGSVSKRSNPNSVIYQQRQLVEQLRLEQAELDRLAELEYQEQLAKEEQDKNSLIQRFNTNSGTGIIRNPSSNNILEELIELEKRGGRARSLDTE